MMNDPIADMLTRLRNGYDAGHKKVALPFSKLKLSLAKVLVAEGFIDGCRETGASGASPKDHQLEMVLRYDERREAVLGTIRRISSPGLKVYYRCKSIPKIKGGLGILVLSTSKGLMTDRQARKLRLGGEAICSVS